MNEKQLDELRKLREFYTYSQKVCNPIEFEYRQHQMFICLIEHILKPLEDYETKQT